MCNVDGGDYRVVIDKHIDLQDVRNLCPLTDWQSLDEILGSRDEKEEVPLCSTTEAEPKLPVMQISECTKEQLAEALTYAKDTKLFPANILIASDFHIEFLYAHFCRQSPDSLVRKANKAKWKEVIRKHLDVFDDSIGMMKCEPYTFSLVDGAKPVRQRPYPLNPTKKDALTKMLKVLLDNDIIEPSTTADWNSPLLLVSKGDGRWRLVVDYRRVNMLIENQAVVYPRPDDLFETVQDAYFMFLIDGRDFYFQRLIDEKLRPVTSFQTHILNYQWKRMPQGLKPSSAAAINPVTRELQDCLHVWALLHCDDFLGWSQTEEQSIERFDWVLGKFRNFGMTLGWFKIWILLDRAEYVSHVIDRGRVYPSPSMVTAIDAVKPPTSTKLVQVFVGMCGYFALYVPMMAHWRAVLTELTKAGLVWDEDTWTEDHQEAFEMIKKLLKSACVYIIDWSLPVVLVTDASGTALGGCLMQKDSKGFYRPLRFMSRSLDKFERMQENREREMRAGLYCMVKCHSVLGHMVFTWITDHANIKWIMIAKMEVQRIARLALWLSTYWYNLQHAAGDSQLMQIADAMSRLPMSSSPDSDIFVPFEDETVQHVLLNSITDKVIECHQQHSITLDTTAKISRSSVEVIPNSMLAIVEHDDECDCDCCRDQLNVLGDLVTEESPSLQSTVDQIGSAMFAVDVFPSVPTSVLALEDSGFTVTAVIENEDFPAELALSASSQIAVFNDINCLTDSISSRLVELPYVSLVQSNLERTSLASVLDLVDSLNRAQPGAEVDVIVTTAVTRKNFFKTNSLKRRTKAMGYRATVQDFVSSKCGSPVHCTTKVCTYTRVGKFPLLQLPDSNPPIVAAMYSSSCRYAQPMECVGHRRQHEVHGLDSAPVLLATSNGKNFYSTRSSIPRIVSAPVHVVVNPSGAPDAWCQRQLTQPEICAAYGLTRDLTVAITAPRLSDEAFCNLFRSVTPYGSLLRLFQGVASRLRASGITSKVGGVPRARTDCASVVLYSFTDVTPNDDDLVCAEISLTGQTASTQIRDAKYLASSSIDPSAPVMFEFFSGTGVMSSSFEKFGWRAVTIDIEINPARSGAKPTINADVLAMDSRCIDAMIEKFGAPEYMHFGPPCNARSKLHPKGSHYKIDARGNYVPVSQMAKAADEAVAKCFEIIDHCSIVNPDIKYTIENPNYHSFKNLPRVRDLIASGNFHILHLNDYNPEFSQKPSCWVHNVETWKARKVTHTLNKHHNAFGRLNAAQRMTYPSELCQEVMEAVIKVSTDKLAPVMTKAMRKAAEQAAKSGPLEDDDERDSTSGLGKRASTLHAKPRKGKPSSKSKAPKGAKANDWEPDRNSSTDSDVGTPSLSPNSVGRRDQDSNSDAEDESPIPLKDVSELTVSKEEIKAVQLTDPLLIQFRAIAEKKAMIDETDDTDVAVKSALQSEYRAMLVKLPTRVEQGNAQHMTVDSDDLIVYAMSNGHWPVPVINSQLGKRVIAGAHDSLVMVHIGSRKVLHWIRQRYWWRGMATDINNHTRTCKLCQKMKFFSQPGAGFMQMRVYDRPGRCISIDIVVLKHRTELGTEYLFTILDCFSHWPDAYPMSDSHAETCAECLLKWCQYNGVPEEVRSDGGLNLNLSSVFKALYALMGISSTVTHPYAPQGNVVERYHRWLGAALRTLFFESDLDVDKSLPYVLWVYRGTENRMTGYTASLLHIGREMRFPLDAYDSNVAHLDPHEYADHIRHTMQSVWRDARIAQSITQEQSASAYNKRHGILKDIEVGSKVLVSRLPTNPGDISTHILPRCVGPYRVLRVTSRGAKLRHVVTGKEIKRSLRQVRRLHERPGDDSDDEEGETNFAAGMLVVVRLHGQPKNAKRKWQVCRLLHTTLDEDAWVVQWYNSHDTGPMTKMRYHPCYVVNDAGDEEFTHKPEPGWKQLQHTVYKRSFITPSFKLDRRHCLPASIRAAILAHPVSKPPKGK